VTLIDALDTVLSFVDRDISSELVKEMEKDGICLKLGHSYERVEVVNHQVSIELSSGETLKTAALLCASGRQGMADQLNLGVCGVEINSRNQLEVNANYQTKVPHIYAVGDVIGFPSLVSVSNEEGRMAAQHAVNQTTVHRVGADIPFGIYTIPEISMIGYTEAQLKKENIPYAVGRCYCKDLARGLIIGDRRGLFKLLFHRQTHELLGVHIFSQSAAELIHIGQSVINFKGKIEYFIDTVFNFPTLSAAYKVAARDGLNQL
jgi:NAD(P) transhydrogenase